MTRLPSTLVEAIRRLDRQGLQQLVREALAELGRRGGRKWGAEGGHARAASMTAKQRSEAARKAVRARWTKHVKKAARKPRR